MRPSLVRRISRLASVVFVLGLGAPDVFADPPRVVLVREPNASAQRWREAEVRTRDEIEASGFSVVEVEGGADPGTDRRLELERLAADHAAVAAVRVARSGERGQVEVWIVDEITGKTSFREIPAEDLGREDAAAVVGLRVVELLHASLLELRASHPPRGTVPAPPAALAIVDRVPAGEDPIPEHQSRPWAARAGLGLVTTGDVGTVGGLDLGVRWAATQALGVGADGHATLLPSVVVDDAGSARIRLGVLRVHGRWSALLGADLRGVVGLGGGAVLVWVDGSARAPYRSRSSVTSVALASLVVEGAFRVGPGLWLAAAADAAVTARPIEIVFAGRTGASGGRPLVGARLGLEWEIP